VSFITSGEAYTGICWVDLLEKDHWGHPDVNGRIILNGIFRK
jgi:hypothetical protein